MSVRKRVWKAKDERKEAWVVDYVDQSRVRHIKTFALKRDADAYHAKVVVEVRAGLHSADSTSITVAEAGELWLESAASASLERATLAAYRQHLDLHITPFIGNIKLSQLTVPSARTFEERLIKSGRSRAMVRKARIGLGALLANAQERGLVAQNVVRGLRRRDRNAERRQNGKLKIGTDIPTPDEIRAIIAKLNGPRRPVLLTAIFAGLRASELRGLSWNDVDLKQGMIHVRQRADRYGTLGHPKTEAGERSIPLLPMLTQVLREHRLACRNSKLDLVFPNSKGRLDHRNSIVEKAFHPAQVAAGVVDQHGAAKYKGLHSLRHFYASWCVNRKVDGGLELPPKEVQARLGHASITITLDVYGHLFPRGDFGAELMAAEQAFFGAR